MGDFERTFGAGANVESIIKGFSRSQREEQRHESKRMNRTVSSKSPPTGTSLPRFLFETNSQLQNKKQVFDSYKKALDWAKANPGKVITRSSDGMAFVEK